MTKVSVVIASYNHAQFLRECVDSALNQTLKPFEVIVVDDYSSDGTAQVLESYADSISVIQHPANLGAATALNNGIGAARGEYVAIHNSDDIWHPEKLQKQLAFMADNQLDASFTTASFIDETSKPLSQIPDHLTVFSRTSPLLGDFLADLFYVSNFLCHPSLIAKKALYEDVGLYDNRFRQLGDYDMWVRFFKAGKVAILDEKLIQYRWHASGNTSNANANRGAQRSLNEMVFILKSFFDGMDESRIFSIFGSLPLARKAFETSATTGSLASNLLLTYPEHPFQPAARVAGFLKAWETSDPNLNCDPLYAVTGSFELHSEHSSQPVNATSLFRRLLKKIPAR